MNHERQDRNRPGLVCQQPDCRGEFVLAEADFGRPAGQGVEQRDERGAFLEGCAQCRKVEIDLRKALVTGSILGAAGEDIVNRALRLERDPGAQRQLRWHDAVDHDGTGRLGVAAGEMLRDAGAI